MTESSVLSREERFIPLDRDDRDIIVGAAKACLTGGVGGPVVSGQRWSGTVLRYEATVVALEARVAELEQDARRLDWLETGPATGLRVLEWPGGWRVEFGDVFMPGQTLREAIDAAMRPVPDEAPLNAASSPLSTPGGEP